MKTYGKKKHWYDWDEVRHAPKSSIRNIEKKGGDIPNTLRSSLQKRRLRKILKTKARQENKKIVIKEEIDSFVGDDLFYEEVYRQYQIAHPYSD